MLGQATACMHGWSRIVEILQILSILIFTTPHFSMLAIFATISPKYIVWYKY